MPTDALKRSYVTAIPDADAVGALGPNVASVSDVGGDRWVDTGHLFFLPQQSDHMLTAVTSVNVTVREKPSDKLKIAIVRSVV